MKNTENHSSPSASDSKSPSSFTKAATRFSTFATSPESEDASFAESLKAENSKRSANLDVETLADRFIDELRAGGKPSVEEYAQRYPLFADEVRELFPALLLLEKGGTRESLSSLSQVGSRQGFAIDGLQRLKNYRIVREIGRGGMGVVYEAWDETLERVVALKVMKLFPGEEEQTIKRFQREAKTAARLHHTNIVPVFGSDVLDDKFFYAMQLIDGLSLEQILQMQEKEASRALESSRGSRHFSLKRKSSRGEGSARISSARPSEDSREHSSRSFPTAPLSESQDWGKTQLAVPRREETQTTLSVDASFDVSPETDSLAETEFCPPPRSPRSEPSQPQPTNDRREKKPRRRNAPPKSDFDAQIPAAHKPLLSLHIASSNYYQRVCDVGIQTAQGLDYAHRHGILHRDVKPSNLILDSDGVVWITDFGLAKPMDENNDLTRQGQLVGTLRYLAPEALEGNFSPLSDVYSLGLTLYELLTFAPAFDETNYSKLLGQVASGQLTRPRKINPKIPIDLETIILKATEKSLSKRYSTAGELADDLQRFLDDRPIRARRVGPIGRGWRWCKRNRLVASLLFSIILLVSAIFTGMTNAYFQAQALLRSKNDESQRAQQNLNLAINAFEEVFSTLGGAVDRSFNFLSETTAFEAPTDNPSITEKDADVLESLLGFYDGFVKENDVDSPSLLLGTARAYVKIGTIRCLLGRPGQIDAFQKSLDFYRRSLVVSSESESERAQIVLEKASALREMFCENSGQDPRFDEFFPLCSESLVELDSIPPSFDDARRKLTALLRFKRAVLKLEKIRRGSAERFGFFEELGFERPSENQAKEIREDFDAVRVYLEGATADAAPQTPEFFLDRNKFYAYYSLWKSTLGQAKEAREFQRKGLEAARSFALFYPNDSRSYLATMIQYVLKTIVDGEISDASESDETQESLAAAENQALGAADALVENFPNSPQYAIFQIVAYYHFAKWEARANEFQRSEALLIKAGELTETFDKTRPNFQIFQFYGPLQAGYSELLIAEKRFDEAETQLEKLEKELNKSEEEQKNSPNVGDQTKERLMRGRKDVERLRRLLATRRAAQN